jgi:hypothetical protein
VDTHAHTRTRARTQASIRTHTRTRARIRIRTHTRTRARTHAHAHAHAHARARTRTHAHAHARTRAHTHTRTHKSARAVVSRAHIRARTERVTRTASGGPPRSRPRPGDGSRPPARQGRYLAGCESEGFKGKESLLLYLYIYRVCQGDSSTNDSSIHTIQPLRYTKQTARSASQTMQPTQHTRPTARSAPLEKRLFREAPLQRSASSAARTITDGSGAGPRGSDESLPQRLAPSP